MINRRYSDSGAQIVQAYAAKKAAQMERAKQLRMEREREKKPSCDDASTPTPSPPVLSLHRNSVQGGFSGDYSSPVPTGSGLSSTINNQLGGTLRHKTVEPDSVQSVLVGESSLLKAVEAGIITLDQSKKLWQSFQKYGKDAEGHQMPSSGEHISSHTKMVSSKTHNAPQDNYAHQQQPQQQQDALSNPNRMHSQLQDAQSRSYQNAPPSAFEDDIHAKPAVADDGWNMDTEITYREPEDDSAFINKCTTKSTPSRPYQQGRVRVPRDDKPEWNSADTMPVMDEPSPPQIPVRKVAPKSTKPASRKTVGKPQRPTPAPVPAPEPESMYERDSYSSAQYSSQPHCPDPSAQVESFSAGNDQDRFEEELMNAQSEQQYPCGNCGRSFRSSVLKRHAKTCGSQKARRVFDTSKQRELDDQQLVMKPDTRKTSAATAAAATAKASKWKQQHAAFQAAMKNNRIASQVESGKLPASALASIPEPVDTRVPCQHCGRKFAPDVADRHIPKCKNILANKPKNMRRF